MKFGCNSKFTFVLRLIFLGVTVALSSYWVYVFYLDEDLINIQYKKYYAKDEDVFPALSICLNNSISEKKLQKLNPNVTVSSYLKFFRGETFDQKFLDIDYQAIIENMTDYIEEDLVRYRNGSVFALNPAYHNDTTFGHNFATLDKSLKFSSNYAFFAIADLFYNCYELSIPHDKNIKDFWFRINSTIFPSGVRPHLFGLVTILHYPNQLLISNTVTHVWPQHRKKDESYSMWYKISGIELLRRRKKCIEHWEEYDNYIMNEHARAVGCRAPYLSSVNDIPLCSTKEQMKKMFHLRSDGYGLLPPCREMVQIYEKYEEGSNKASFEKKGVFWIGFSVNDENFKEIFPTR